MRTLIAGVVLLAGVSLTGMASAAGDAAAGEAVYNKVCKMCHATGMMSSPKAGDRAAWAPRLAQGEATLIQHAIKGFGNMPPKGTCKACSDEDIANAVAYMMNLAR